MIDDLLERYRRDGYAVMEALITPKEVSDLRDEGTRLCLEKGKALVGASGEVPPRGLSRDTLSS
jgi:hypothetical protein